MTVEEFSAQFDLLYSNITSNQAPGLNEWEKSVFLTKGQDETVKNHFSAKSNPKQEGFDDSPKRQADFSSIIKKGVLTEWSGEGNFDFRSRMFKFPADMLLSLNEQITSGGVPFTVLPISYEEYNRLMSKPYKYPPKYQAWRLITGQHSMDTAVSETETIDGTEYTLRIVNHYVKPVEFVVTTVAAAAAEYPVGNKPVVEETAAKVTITCALKQGTLSADYWAAFLLNSATNRRARALNSPVLEQYVGNFTNEDGDSMFPPFEVPVATDPLFDLTNSKYDDGSSSTIVEIIGRFPKDSITYSIRYIRQPRPIILTDLTAYGSELTIRGYSVPMTSELPEELHEEILQRAVELAKVAWQGDLNATIQTGQRSE